MISVASNRLVPLVGRVRPAERAPIFRAIAEVWRDLRKGLLNTYRPELHYMRGPGPKWREKHGAPDAIPSDAHVRTLRGATA